MSTVINMRTKKYNYIYIYIIILYYIILYYIILYYIILYYIILYYILFYYIIFITDRKSKFQVTLQKKNVLTHAAWNSCDTSTIVYFWDPRPPISTDHLRPPRSAWPLNPANAPALLKRFTTSASSWIRPVISYTLYTAYIYIYMTYIMLYMHTYMYIHLSSSIIFF